MSTVRYSPLVSQEPVLNGRDGHDNGLVEFPFQTFLDDLQVQKSEKAAAKTQAERRRRILLIDQGRVIQLVLFKRLSERE